MIKTDVYISKLKNLASNDFEKKLLAASIKILDQKNNPLKINNFAASIRELFRHILTSLAPDYEVTKCDWFKWEETENGKKTITRKQRIKYAIQKNLPDIYIHKNISDLDDSIKRITNIYKSLNKYTHIEEDSFELSEKDEEEFASKILNIFCEFCDVIKDAIDIFNRDLENLIESTVSSEFFMENIDNVDCLSTHSRPDDISVGTIEIVDKNFDNISVKVNGTVCVSLQYGSDGDCERGDGCETNACFPFESEVEIKIDDNFPDSSEILSFNVNTNSFYE